MRETAIVRRALIVLAFRDKENMKTYLKALRNRSVLEAVTAEATVRAESEVGAIGDGTFLELFQWVLDNWEEILKIIMIFMAE
jgi:hypothetical protein